MSELRTYDVIMTPSSDGSWVLKSEADKVIARHKYKRCVAMAELCRAKRDEIIARTPTLILNHPTEYLTRCENRWLELAEKFKEAHDAEE